MRSFLKSAILVSLISLTGPLQAQLDVFSREDLVRLTPQNPYGRFQNGRPRVPDELLDRLKSVSVEQAWDYMKGRGYVNQWEGNWNVIHPDVKLVGRAVTARFMPFRPDINEIIERKAGKKGLARAQNLRVLDVLQKKDVVVVDLYGKFDEGTFVGGNLATAVYARTGTGLVVDGSIRDIEEIMPLSDLVLYVRNLHPSAIGNTMLTGINVPVRIGGVTVMPGDAVLGDAAGVIFIAPQFVEPIVEEAQRINLKDEFTKMKMLEGKYDPSQIYPTMSEEVQKEFEEWKKKRQDKK